MSTSSKTIVLISSDGEKFAVDLDTVANLSLTVKTGFEVDETNSFGFNIDDICSWPLPLYDVPSNILSMIIDYCKKHFDKTVSDEDLKAFDSEFVKVDNRTLFGLINAAVYMHIESLLDLTCLAVLDMVKDMSPEEIYKTLDIKNDFTPKEVERLYIRDIWAFHEIKLKKETESKLSTLEFAHLTDKEKRKMDKESFMQRVLPAASPTEFAYLASEEKKEWVLVAVLITQLRVKMEAAASSMQTLPSSMQTLPSRRQTFSSRKQSRRQRLAPAQDDNKLYPTDDKREMSNLDEKLGGQEEEETEETKTIVLGLTDLFAE